MSRDGVLAGPSNAVYPATAERFSQSQLARFWLAEAMSCGRLGRVIATGYLRMSMDVAGFERTGTQLVPSARIPHKPQGESLLCFALSRSRPLFP